MTKSPSPSVDEVEAIIDAVMASARYAPKTVPMGANPPLFDGMQPDNDGPWVSRVDVAKRLRASLVSPPKAGAGEPDAWKIYKPGKFVELTISLVAAEAAIASGYEVVPLYEARGDHIPDVGKMVANHEARGDGVRVKPPYVSDAGDAPATDATTRALPPLGDGRAEIVEACARVADALAERQAETNRKHPDHVKVYPAWEAYVDKYREVAAAIRSLSNPGGSE